MRRGDSWTQEQRPGKDQPQKWVTLWSGVSEAGWAWGSLWDNKDTFLTDGDELEVVERGCTHPEKSNRTMSYRTGMKIITLTEAVCGTNLCNKPTSGELGSPHHPQPRTHHPPDYLPTSPNSQMSV